MWVPVETKTFFLSEFRQKMEPILEDASGGTPVAVILPDGRSIYLIPESDFKALLGRDEELALTGPASVR